MQYENTPISSNVEDRRGQGGGGGMPMGRGGLGIGAIIIVFAISYFTGIIPAGADGRRGDLIGNSSNSAAADPAGVERARRGPERSYAKFLAHIMGATEDVWTDGAAAADRRQVRACDAGHL